VVVPGHGPITDKARVVEFRNFMVWFREETRKRYESGQSILDAAVEIAELPSLPDWQSPERIVGAVNFLFRQYGSTEATANLVEIYALFDRFLATQAARCADHSACNHKH
jgi:cyclase